MNTSNTIINPTSQAQSAPAFECPAGFDYQGKRIMFIESKGKDISFPRWRFALYYAPCLAETHFEDSADAAIAFLAAHTNDCYADYSDYRAAVQS